MSDRSYIAINLKSFYASVECAERRLDPLTTNLVVANRSRTEKTICLAVSPSLKSFGISGRARLFEVVQRVKEINNARLRRVPGHTFTGSSSNINELNADPSLSLDYIVATPQMAHYIQRSTEIYQVYPKQYRTLFQWYSEYQANTELKLKITRKPKFSDEQRSMAVQHYFEHERCISRTVRMLGYPSRTTLKQWICEEYPDEFPPCTRSSSSVKLTKEEKEQAVINLYNEPINSDKKIVDSKLDFSYDLNHERRPTYGKETTHTGGKSPARA